jgi:hypothetical protein
MKHMHFLLPILTASPDTYRKEASLRPNYIRAQRDGKSWNSDIGLFYNAANNTLVISVTRETGEGPEEIMSFRINYYGDGFYPLNDDHFSYYFLQGGDVASNRYIIDPRQRSGIKITDFNYSTGRISGTFFLRLIRKDLENTRIPVRLDFINGLFEATF